MRKILSTLHPSRMLELGTANLMSSNWSEGRCAEVCLAGAEELGMPLSPRLEEMGGLRSCYAASQLRVLKIPQYVRPKCKEDTLQVLAAGRSGQIQLA